MTTIGVNARFLTRPYTGIGIHTSYLFAALAKQNPDVRFLLAVPHAPSHAVYAGLPANAEIQIVSEKFPGSSGLKKTFWEQFQLPAFFRKKKVDLMHFPYPSNPWFKPKIPVCVTVHDTIPWELPAYHKSWLTRLYQNRAKNALKKADHIFTVSLASKQQILHLLPILKNKISISYNAPPPIFQQQFSPQLKQQILKKYSLAENEPYFLYVGGFDERKNVRTLVEVFAREIAPHFKIDLLLAGGKTLDGSLYAGYDELTETVEEISRNKNRHVARQGKIRPIGFVAEDDLPVLYQSAFAFINLSTFEGCNLPLLEAAVSGTPIITSSLAVHHEFVDGYAAFVPPLDRQKLTETLHKFLTDSDFYHHAHTKIKNYRCPFSWEKTAKNVFEVYLKLLN